MLKDTKILMVIASQNFRDEEYQQPRNIFQAQGTEVTVACSSLQPSKGMLGLVVKPDIILEQVKPEEYAAVIFVGGMGASEYWDHPTAHQIAQTALTTGKIVGAICIAPVTLARAGLLNGKKATVWDSEKGNIQKEGAIYTGKAVEIDGKIITGRGPAAAKEFGQTIVQALSKK